MSSRMIELRAGDATATIVADLGGRVGSLTVAGEGLLLGGGPDDPPTMWGSFPAAPWVGRLRDGRFTHDGIEHRVPVGDEPHALHGTVYDQPWERTDDGGDPAVVELARPLGPIWPLGGTAEQRIELHPHELRATLAVVAGDRSMPADIGWHPWFPSPGPIALAADAMYEREGALPTGRLVPATDGPWDDCFVTTSPVRFPVGSREVAVSGDDDHVVVFNELPGRIAVEPQSGPPDSFHIRPRILAPGERLQRTMTIAWR